MKVPTIRQINPETLIADDGSGTNIFGGGNPHGAYVPLSDDEIEVLHRIVDSGDVQLVIHGWAVLDQPLITFGDLRVGIKFRLSFENCRPTPLNYLDLELRFASGETIFRQKLPVETNGQPVMVGEGVFLDLAWDIAIDHMKPEFVKRIKPGALGLTSRRLDKDTGERTFKGNMQLSHNQQNWLKAIDDGARDIREADAKKIIEAVNKQKSQ